MRTGSSRTPPGATPAARGGTTLILTSSNHEEAMMFKTLSRLKPKPRPGIHSTRTNRRDAVTQAPLIRTLW